MNNELSLESISNSDKEQELQSILDWFTEKEHNILNNIWVHSVFKNKEEIEEENKEELKEKVPESTSDALVKILSKRNDINVYRLSERLPYELGSLKNYLTGEKEFDNNVIAVICHILNIKADDLIETNKKWIRHKYPKNSIYEKFNEKYKNEICNLKKDFYETNLKYKRIIQNEITYIQDYKKEIINHKDELIKKNELIKNLDSDNILSDIINNIQKYSKDEIFDKILSAKNGLIKLVEEKNHMYTFEEKRDLLDKIDEMKHFRNIQTIMIIGLSLLTIILSIIVFIKV